MEHQLDDAVVLQRGQRDQLRCGGNYNPESRMRQDFFDVHGMQMARDLILAPFVFQHSNSITVFVKP